jgi:hypothetical protein
VSGRAAAEAADDAVMAGQISAYLEARGLRFAVQDAVHIIAFAAPAATGADATPALVVLVWAGRTAAGGVMVELHAPALPGADVAALLRRCNEWNITSRATKARLHTEAETTVVFESWLPAPSGVSDDVLHTFLDAALSDLGECWPVVEALSRGSP